MGDVEYESSSEEEMEEESNKHLRPYNDPEAMEHKLKQMKSDMKWIEHLDITVDLKDVNIPGQDDNDKANKNEGVNSEIQDDFKREMIFYCQAQIAAKTALSRLREMNVITERPEDYFAEMVKTDTHMHKIRHKLQERKEGMEKSEKAKKQRQLKKIGKKVQQDIIKKRQEDKKRMLNTVDRIKRGKGKLEDLTKRKDDELFDVSREDSRKSGQKRKRKDEKFGFGGKKRKVKKNSAESSGEMSSFKSHIHGKAKNSHKANPNKSKLVNKNKGKRLGKSRRVTARSGKR